MRSWRGGGGAWFRHASRTGRALVRLGGDEVGVVVEPTPMENRELREAIDAAYRSKYGRHGNAHVAPITSDVAPATTLRFTGSG